MFVNFFFLSNKKEDDITGEVVLHQASFSFLFRKSNIILT